MQIDLSLVAPPSPAGAKRAYPRAVRTSQSAPTFAAGAAASRCADVIGDVSREMNLHAVSVGEWSLHDVIAHLASQIAPCTLHLATWSISEDGFRALLRERDEGRVTAIRALFDWRVKVRNPSTVQLARAQCDSVRVASCHAKAALLRSDDYALSVLTSANLTGNPRIEIYNIVDALPVWNFHSQWIEQEIANGVDIREATQGKARRW